MKDIEVLSPVGSRDSLIAAVRSGADAVYLGLPRFNARQGAENFDREGFAEAVKYCHIRGVRVYLTLNTVLSEKELPQAVEEARTAYNMGVDAAIVQDLGLARILHERLPQLPLHASTQLTVHSPAALPLLKELGFTQVVLSREMSREEIKAFCEEAKKYDIAVEIFIHGALCMCMSGQCYLSAMLGSRSGNRGLCAGPCRLPFSADGGTGYDLSLKDLSLVRYIEELKSFGIKTLKIEGRMKRPEYVACATAVCRKAIDGEDYSEQLDTLHKIFSRSGFTDGYYTSRLGKDMFGIRTKEDVMLSAAVIKQQHELYRAERQSVEIEGEFSLKIGEPMRFTVSDGENTVCAEGAAAEPARSREADRDNVLSQLKKTGSTPYIFKDIKTDIGSGAAISAGALNALRRDALNLLSEKRHKENSAPEIALEKSAFSNKRNPALYARFSSIEQIPCDIEGIKKVIVPLEADFYSLSLGCEVALDIPRGIKNEEKMLSQLKRAKECGISEAFCGNIAAVELCKRAGISPIFDFSMNIFNSESLKTAESLGAKAATLSFELTAEQITAIGGDIPVGIIGYGRLPLMLTRNCPLKNGAGCKGCDGRGFVTDRMGISFPVRCREGYSELFNSRPLVLSDRMQEFSTDYITLYFTSETRDECSEVISSYRCHTSPKGEYTRGLYYRGVE